MLEEQINEIYKDCYYTPFDCFTLEEIEQYLSEGLFDTEFENRTERFTMDTFFFLEAMEYLKENDLSLLKSLTLASELGYETRNLDSNLLAGLLMTENERTKQDYCFEKLKELYDDGH